MYSIFGLLASLSCVYQAIQFRLLWLFCFQGSRLIDAPREQNILIVLLKSTSNKYSIKKDQTKFSPEKTIIFILSPLGSKIYGWVGGGFLHSYIFYSIIINILNSNACENERKRD